MNPFRVLGFFFVLIPGLSLRSNPGLRLANAFGVIVLLDRLRHNRVARQQLAFKHCNLSVNHSIQVQLTTTSKGKVLRRFT